jgi:hypothetical protein
VTPPGRDRVRGGRCFPDPKHGAPPLYPRPQRGSNEGWRCGQCWHQTATHWYDAGDSRSRDRPRTRWCQICTAFCPAARCTAARSRRSSGAWDEGAPDLPTAATLRIAAEVKRLGKSEWDWISFCHRSNACSVRPIGRTAKPSPRRRGERLSSLEGHPRAYLRPHAGRDTGSPPLRRPPSARVQSKKVRQGQVRGVVPGTTGGACGEGRGGAQESPVVVPAGPHRRRVVRFTIRPADPRQEHYKRG